MCFMRTMFIVFIKYWTPILSEEDLYCSWFEKNSAYFFICYSIVKDDFVGRKYTHIWPRAS
jgi:hypothetical protein